MPPEIQEAIDEFEYYFRFHASQCANWKEVELKLIEK